MKFEMPSATALTIEVVQLAIEAARAAVDAVGRSKIRMETENRIEETLG
jgi:hypothetical protein